MILRKYTIEDKDILTSFFKDFYRSEAMAHPLDDEQIELIYHDALCGQLTGLILLEENTPIGFAHLSSYYATEVSGKCLMIEDLYIAPKYRGKGLSGQFFRKLFSMFPDIKRLRLEVSKENSHALAVYEHLGFKPIPYNNMVLDIKPQSF